MKTTFRTPLKLKLLIATVFWALFYWLLSLIWDNQIYHYILWGSGALVLGYNLAILVITNKRNKNPTKKVKDNKNKYDDVWAI